MRIRGGCCHLVAVTVALTVSASGCSWIVMRNPAEVQPGAPARDAACSDSYEAIVVDGILAAGATGLAIATGVDRCTFNNECILGGIGKIALAAFSTLAAVFIASTITGVVLRGRCAAAKRAGPKTLGAAGGAAASLIPPVVPRILSPLPHDEVAASSR